MAAYEGAIFNALYEDPPAGFRKAIEYANAYNRLEPNQPSARIFVYLAAAYGQEFAYLTRRQASNEELQEIRGRALAAARGAIELDRRMVYVLGTMWNPSAPGKFPGDNDLEVFFDDPDFQKLLQAT